MIILKPNAIESSSIILETRKKRQIENRQIHELANYALSESKDIERDFVGVILRTGPNPIYNCHGLTFASRRTGIDVLPWDVISEDDGYTEIQEQKVLAGDVVLYFGTEGAIEHSGIVVGFGADNIPVPLVLSKWGSYGEVIHRAHAVPEKYGQVRRYYRVTK